MDRQIIMRERERDAQRKLECGLVYELTDCLNYNGNTKDQSANLAGQPGS